MYKWLCVGFENQSLLLTLGAKNNLFSRMVKTSGAYLCLGEKNWRRLGDGRSNAVISSIRSDRWVFINGPYLHNKTLSLLDKRGIGIEIEIGKRVSLPIFFWGEGGVCTQARMMKKKSRSELMQVMSKLSWKSNNKKLKLSLWNGSLPFKKVWKRVGVFICLQVDDGTGGGGGIRLEKL